MIWQNAWAWLGLLTLAAPIVIHLLARRSARVQRFPTLRFLHASQFLPARSTRLSDLLLLLLRLAIVAVAVAALAQPLLLTPGRQRSLGRTLARAILVDTSASMARATNTGEPGSAVARREAQRLADEAQLGVIVETIDPAEQIAGAANWLERQAARRELVVISDFQVGAIDPGGFGSVPAETGIRLVRVAARPASGPIEVTARTAAGETTARVNLQPRSTVVEWSQRTAPMQSGNLLLLTGRADSAAASAALHSASGLASVRSADPTRPIALVYPGYEQREHMLREARPLNRPWMGDVVTRLRDQTSLERAARGNVAGRERLLLFTNDAPGSIESASLILSALQAQEAGAPASENEPANLDDRTLMELQRTPATVVAPRDLENEGISDGRWLWLGVLLLLALETWLRRGKRERQGIPETHAAYERVA
jgi:hypothetical protein